MGVTALAEDASSEYQVIDSVSETYINPLYADVITESDLNEPSEMMMADEDIDYCDSMEAAAGEVREQMKQREETIQVGYATTENCTEEAVKVQMINDVVAAALVHTGNPEEGDYLKWQYAGWSGKLGGYSLKGTSYLIITYTITYYTSLEQEAQMDDAVNTCLSELQLDGKSTYEKICSIYDYICSNVTYDYETLGDDSYKLKFTAYAALINKTAVCQGYALLFYRLALEEGIDTRLIAGTGNGGTHAWNIVELDGKYYNLDATWDSSRAQSNRSYAYFLKCSDSFVGHIRNDEYATEAFETQYPMGETDYEISDGESEESKEDKENEENKVNDNSDVENLGNIEDDSNDVENLESEETSWTIQYVLAGGSNSQSNPTTVGEEEVIFEDPTRSGYTFEGWYTSADYSEMITDLSEGEKEDITVYAKWKKVSTGKTEISEVTNKGSSGLTVTLSKVSGASGYVIECSTDNSFQVIAKKKTTSSIKAVSVTGLSAGKTYYVRARAYKLDSTDTRIYGKYSTVVKCGTATTAPAISKVTGGSKQIKLQWKSVSGATKYQVYMATSKSGTYSKIATLDTGKTSYTKTGLSVGKTYYFKVRTYRTVNSKNIYSSYSTIRYGATSPAKVTISKAACGANKITVSWNKVTGASGYEIYMATSSSGTYKKLTTVGSSKTSYIESGLANGKTYYFKVRAYRLGENDAKVYGAYSTVKSATTTVLSTVYVTKSGACFHRATCSTLSRSKNVTQMKRVDAIAKGYRACSVCKP